MQPQTRQAMTHIGTILSKLGAGYGDIRKLTTTYEGPPGLEAMHENHAVRSSLMPALAYPRMIIEIDTFAMTTPDA